MTNNRTELRAVFVAVLLTLIASPNTFAASVHGTLAPQWTIEVERVEPGSSDIDPAFSAAIYENLLEELSKSKQFNQVFRTGDRNATTARHLVILTTKIQSYTPGSETKRAVTTLSGATKLGVIAQLRTNDGRVLVERSVNGSVRFIGGNLRATRNLARNVVRAIRDSPRE